MAPLRQCASQSLPTALSIWTGQHVQTCTRAFAAAHLPRMESTSARALCTHACSAGGRHSAPPPNSSVRWMLSFAFGAACNSSSSGTNSVTSSIERTDQTSHIAGGDASATTADVWQEPAPTLEKASAVEHVADGRSDALRSLRRRLKTRVHGCLHPLALRSLARSSL